MLFVLVFTLPVFKAAPVNAEIAESLIALRRDDDKQEKEDKKQMDTDVNIKGIDLKSLFNTPISTSNSPLTTVLTTEQWKVTCAL